MVDLVSLKKKFEAPNKTINPISDETMVQANTSYSKIGDEQRANLRTYLSNKASHNMQHANSSAKKEELNKTFLRSSAIQDKLINTESLLAEMDKKRHTSQSFFNKRTGITTFYETPKSALNGAVF